MMEYCWVPGNPAPKGSVRVYTRTRRGRHLAHPVVTHDNPRTAGWQAQIAAAMRSQPWISRASGACPAPRGTPVALYLAFALRRPKTVKSRKHTVKPDLDKLARLVCDALTGIVYWDDAQVQHLRAIKFYSLTPGVHIWVGCNTESDLEHNELERAITAAKRALEDNS